MSTYFWQKTPLKSLSKSQWESLCDGCGLCCLHKLQDEQTDDIYYIQVACKLLDCQSCQCSNYPQRKQLVTECLVLDYKMLEEAQHWLPDTCAYRRVYLGQDLPPWHPLLTKDPDSVHKAGISAQSFAISETKVNMDDLEDYII